MRSKNRIMTKQELFHKTNEAYDLRCVMTPSIQKEVANLLINEWERTVGPDIPPLMCRMLYEMYCQMQWNEIYVEYNCNWACVFRKCKKNSLLWVTDGLSDALLLYHKDGHIEDLRCAGNQGFTERIYEAIEQLNSQQ